MIILSITDIHGDINKLEGISTEINQVDLVILTGDITHFGYNPEIEKTINRLKKINQNIFAVSGNCDHIEVEEFLVNRNYSLNKKIIRYSGINFLGISGSLPCPGVTPNEYREEELENFLTCIKNDHSLTEPFILVSHQPPFGTVCDKLPNGQFVGSPSLREFIEETQPLVCLTGHIHEGIGHDKIGKTIVINPGPLSEGGYAIIDVDDSGVKNFECKKTGY